MDESYIIACVDNPIVGEPFDPNCGIELEFLSPRGKIAMTLILAAEASDGIVMAADAREINAGIYTDVANKIYQVAANCCIGLSGSAAWGEPVIQQLISESGLTTDMPVDVLKIGIALRDLMRESIRSGKAVELTNKKDVRLPVFILSGFLARGASEDNPRIYVLAHGAEHNHYEPMHQPRFSRIGFQGAILHLEKYIRTGNFGSLSMTQLDKAVIFLMREAAGLAPNIHGPFTLYHITGNGVEEIDVSTLSEEASGFKQRLLDLVNEWLT